MLNVTSRPKLVVRRPFAANFPPTGGGERADPDFHLFDRDLGCAIFAVLRESRAQSSPRATSARSPHPLSDHPA
jgi:hypothetical protein